MFFVRINFSGFVLANNLAGINFLVWPTVDHGFQHEIYCVFVDVSERVVLLSRKK